MHTPFQKRRPTRERIQRLFRHPIQTVRESSRNRSEKKWQNYYAAAKMLGQSEKNARLYADQIVGRKISTRITSEVESFLDPVVKVMRERQAVKSKVLELIDRDNTLARRLIRETPSKLVREKMLAQQIKLQYQIDLLTEGRLPRIEGRLKLLVSSMVKKL